MVALAGGVIGFFYGTGTEEDSEPDPSCWFYCYEPSRESKIAVDVVIGLLAGGAIGYVMGMSRWEDIPVKKLRIALQPASKNSVSLSLAIRF